MILEKILKWCSENNMSLAALEKQCGLGNATIRGWDKSSPNMKSLVEVSKFTGLSIEEIISETK